MPNLESTAQAATRLHLTPGRIVQLATAGDIPGAIKPGRDWLIPSTWKYTTRRPRGCPPGGWKTKKK